MTHRRAANWGGDIVSLGTAALDAGDKAARERLEGLDSVDMNKPHIRFSYAFLPPLPESTRRRLVALASPPPTRLQSCLTAMEQIIRMLLRSSTPPDSRDPDLPALTSR